MRPPSNLAPASSRRGLLVPLECKKTFSGRAASQIPPGELTAFPQTSSLAAPPQEPHTPTLGPLGPGLRPSPLTRNRRLAASIGPPTNLPIVAIARRCRQMCADIEGLTVPTAGLLRFSFTPLFLLRLTVPTEHDRGAHCRRDLAWS